MTADAKYSLQNTENLLQSIQRNFSQKPKRFSDDFIAVLESTINLEHLEKKLEPHSLSISKIIHSKKRDYLNA